MFLFIVCRSTSNLQHWWQELRPCMYYFCRLDKPVCLDWNIWDWYRNQITAAYLWMISSDLLCLFFLLFYASRPALKLTPCECLCLVDVKWRTSQFCVGPSPWTKRSCASFPNLLNQQVTTKQQLNKFGCFFCHTGSKAVSRPAAFLYLNAVHV